MCAIMRSLILFSVTYICANAAVASKKDHFVEELLLKPLHSGQLYAHFQFTTLWEVDSSTEDLFQSHLFSRALSEIITRHNVQELHVSLTAGLWRYETWGYPVVDAAPGAEAWAWFKSDTVNVDDNWKKLSNSLSGLLCASLSAIDHYNSISPEKSFRPRGVLKEQSLNSSFLRYAALPREIVCTENLTPWKKLLPCDSKLGLASLLNAGSIHTTRYHSVSIHLRPICRDWTCELTSLELQQSVDLVYDYLILGDRNWSLRKLFGQGVMNLCPLADSSSIYVDVSSNSSNVFELVVPPDEYVTSVRGGEVSKFAKYKLQSVPINVAANYIEKENYLVNIPPALYASQYKMGYGQQQGGLITKLYNNHWSSLNVVVLQNIPWFVPVYVHTLKIESNGVPIKPTALKYKPGKLREEPHNIELILKVPAKSTVSIQLNFDYVFLKWQEYPPDANHGFYIGSTVVSALLPVARNFSGVPHDASVFADSFNASRNGYLVEVRTESVVITLPTPDFSMPYNVICLACTVVALAFGPLHNITTKRLILKVSNENIATRLKQFVLKRMNRRQALQDGNEADSSEQQ